MHLQSLREYQQAKATIMPLIKAFPTHPDINYLFATILVSTKEFQKSISHFNVYLKAYPGALNCWNDLGCTYKDSGRYEEAIDCYKKALSISSKYHPALTNLAGTYFEMKQFENANEYIKKAMEIEANIASDFLLLGNILKNTSEVSSAISAFRQAFKIDPNYYQAYYNLALLLKNNSNLDDALMYCTKALQLNSRYHLALMLYGEINEQLGNIGVAVNSYKECIDIMPTSTSAYWSLANLGAAFDASTIEKMIQLTKQPSSDKDKIFLFFSLAKIMEDQQEYSSAFKYLDKANKIKSEEINYNPEQIDILISRLHKVFTVDFIEKFRGKGDCNISPIFIIGMPRSGTSLVEQILSGSSLVEGGGELETSLALFFEELPKLTGQDWFSSLVLLDATILNKLAKKYRETNANLVNANVHFTDKLPFNFALVGFLSLIFPKAKFIHTFKHPLDSCLSCYKQLFTKGQDFSYDLNDIADYYLQYEKIMNHWDQVCPGKIFHMNYEQLISSPQEQTSKMLAFLDIPWEQACLGFQNNRRIVKTASAGQVRKGIYKSAVSRWKNYSINLEPISKRVMERTIYLKIEPS